MVVEFCVPESEVPQTQRTRSSTVKINIPIHVGIELATRNRKGILRYKLARGHSIGTIIDKSPRRRELDVRFRESNAYELRSCCFPRRSEQTRVTALATDALAVGSLSSSLVVLKYYIRNEWISSPPAR